ncbi:translation initiation factor 3 subunit A [Plasmodium inui San Antonio 1]|uniref:Eukaryotic translation initiation factor 3 subunit A n=1 Tax=Plasmodium inui San Antonio 1 TaxID=1237626 RepID=W7AU89_9APIC|nr:translation initiation factor 3 subunit A [Plasmodium inui San Antonio 1]EUD68991.1 translation initiation factor 3 subunit A [Plasmodium inui San Antonio 1]
MQTFQKPENALKRAEELQFIGQNEDALQILHAAIGHRTFRLQGWHILQEQIMLRYIEFCLYLEKLSLVKDGLHQYRIICQHGNIASLGKVITDFRDKAEEKVRLAKENVNLNKEKMEQDESNVDFTERILISSLDIEISGKYERKLQNSFRICMETYKMILEILRATPKLEKAYHETAKKALIFCKENKRLTEFKKLSDLLRNHYNLILRGKHKPEYQSLLKIEYHLETKIIQLEAACELGMWKEASNIAEDIYNLNMHDYFYRTLRANPVESEAAAAGENATRKAEKEKRLLKGDSNETSKKGKDEGTQEVQEEDSSRAEKKDVEMEESAKDAANETKDTKVEGAQTVAHVNESSGNVNYALAKSRENLKNWIGTFYQRMAEILFVYDSELFHGLAWLKYCFHILNYSRNIPEKEKTFICTKAVLAVVSIPLVGNKKKNEDYAKIFEAHKKMSQLLGHTSVPIKESLKNGLKVRNIISCAEESAQKLYLLIENQFTPLSLCLECDVLLKDLEATDHKVYIGKIKEVIFHKLILQLSKVYSYISIDYFIENICPESFISWNEAEKLLVDLVYQKELEMRIDLIKRAIYFGDKENTNSSKLIKESLTNLYHELQTGLKMINETISIENEVEHLHMKKLTYEKEFDMLDRGHHKIMNYDTANIEDIIENEVFEDKPIENERLLKKIYDKIDEEHHKFQLLSEENSRKRKELLRKQKELEQAQLKIKMEKKLLEEKLEKEKREELAKKGEKQRIKEEKNKKKSEAAEQMLKEIKKLCTNNTTKILMKGKYLDEITIDDILNGYVDFEDIEEAQEKLRLNERNEIIKVRKMEYKKVDHYFRALRQVELSHMNKWIALVFQEDTEILLQEQKAAEEEQKADFEAALREKEEYVKFSNDIEEFTKSEMKDRIAEFEKNLKDQKDRLHQILKDEKVQRAKERREQHLRKLKAEEERKRREEEEERLMKEEMERKKKEEAHRKRLDEISRIQRERDLEIEQQLLRRKEESRNGDKYYRKYSYEDDFSCKRGDKGGSQHDEDNNYKRLDDPQDSSYRDISDRRQRRDWPSRDNERDMDRERDRDRERERERDKDRMYRKDKEYRRDRSKDRERERSRERDREYRKGTYYRRDREKEQDRDREYRRDRDRENGRYDDYRRDRDRDYRRDVDYRRNDDYRRYDDYRRDRDYKNDRDDKLDRDYKKGERSGKSEQVRRRDRDEEEYERNHSDVRKNHDVDDEDDSGRVEKDKERDSDNHSDRGKNHHAKEREKMTNGKDITKNDQAKNEEGSDGGGDFTVFKKKKRNFMKFF